MKSYLIKNDAKQTIHKIFADSIGQAKDLLVEFFQASGKRAYYCSVTSGVVYYEVHSDMGVCGVSLSEGE